MKQHNVVWLSANRFGYELLREARRSVPRAITAIVTLAQDSKTTMYDGVERSDWKTFSIPVYYVQDAQTTDRVIKSLKPRVLVVCGWRQMIGAKTVSMASGGTIGFHPTLLPRGRGPAPIINSILEGIRNSGVTMMYLNDRVDAGGIIAQEKFTINPDDTATEVYEKVIKGGRTLIKKHFPKIVRGNTIAKPQNESRATYFQPRTVKDNEIFPSDDAQTMYRKIRAFTKPYRGAFLQVKKKKLIIWNAELHEE